MNRILVRRTNYRIWPERFHPFWRSAGHRNKVSCGAVYQWETGKFVPKGEKKAVLVALWKLGRREARGSWVSKPFSHPQNGLRGGLPEEISKVKKDNVEEKPERCLKCGRLEGLQGVAVTLGRQTFHLFYLCSRCGNVDVKELLKIISRYKEVEPTWFRVVMGEANKRWLA